MSGQGHSEPAEKRAIWKLRTYAERLISFHAVLLVVSERYAKLQVHQCGLQQCSLYIFNIGDGDCFKVTSYGCNTMESALGY